MMPNNTVAGQKLNKTKLNSYKDTSLRDQIAVVIEGLDKPIILDIRPEFFMECTVEVVTAIHSKLLNEDNWGKLTLNSKPKENAKNGYNKLVTLKLGDSRLAQNSYKAKNLAGLKGDHKIIKIFTWNSYSNPKAEDLLNELV